MFRTTYRIILVLLLCLPIVAQKPPEEKPAWNVTLKTNMRVGSTLTAQNRCKKKHKFEILLENLSFLEISQMEFEVKGGKNKIIPVLFNTTGLSPAVYKGNVIVKCRNCNKEPTCTQDREILPVILTVTGIPKKVSIATVSSSAGQGKSKDPCEKLRNKCDNLLKIANAKKAVADARQAEADKARGEANKAEKNAKDLEEKAKQAAALAEVKPPTGRGSVDGGQEYTTADSAYLAQMNAQVVADYQSGKISVEEHQKRLKENTIEKARKERIKNEARLKREAKAAKKKAADARTAADKAKGAADAAQKIADAANAEADVARKAYEECVKKANDECNKLKLQIAAAARKAEEARLYAEAEKKRKAAEAARLATEERKRKEAAAIQAAAEEKRRIATETRIQKQREILRTIYRQMYRLGFIAGSEIDENRVYLNLLSKFVENPPQKTVEEGLLPDEVLEAFRNMKLVRNPCGNNIVKQRAWKQLETMINPRTGRRYTDNEAQRALNEMCRLLRRLGARQDALNKYYEKGK